MRICESSSAELFREAASFFLDDVNTRISDLETNAQMFGADLVRVTKKKIFERYINFIRDVIESGSGISLNDIRDMINDKETIFITNSEVKTYLTETFESEIQFAPSERKKESHMVFSSSTSTDDVMKRLRSIDSTKLAAKKIRDVFLAMDFNLQDKFCDIENLRNSWEQFCIPDELITFFGTLFNINYATLKPNFPNQIIWKMMITWRKCN